MIDTELDSTLADSQRVQRALLAYSQKKLAHWPDLTEDMVSLLLAGAEETPTPQATSVETVRLPEDMVQAAILWAHMPPTAGYMSLPNGKFLTEQDLSQWLVQIFQAHPALCRDGLAEGAYQDYVEQRDRTLRALVLSAELRYAEVPLDVAGAILDWYHLPEEGSFIDGPSVEDVCESLGLQIQTWGRVPLEDDVCDAFAAAERTFSATGIAFPSSAIEDLSVED